VTFPADYEGAIVVEAKRYGRDQVNVPQAWCLHTPEEPPDETPSTPWYFHNNDVGSTTYFVAWTGLVFQCVPEERRAYANPRNKGVPFAWEDPNKPLDCQTLSVEIEGYAATIHLTMPRGSPQWVALVRLMADRCRARGFPPERTFGHYQVSTQRTDPGRLDIGALVADVRALMDWKEDTMKAIVIVDPKGTQAMLTTDGRKYVLGSQAHKQALIDAGLVAAGDEPVKLAQAAFDAIPNG
jgi:N-acetyl-anhydromuramyl-L-alanine amidase AmpD